MREMDVVAVSKEALARALGRARGRSPCAKKNAKETSSARFDKGTAMAKSGQNQNIKIS